MEALNKLIEKLYYISHIPSYIQEDSVSIVFTQKELDYLVLFLTDYKQIKEETHARIHDETNPNAVL